MEASVLGPLLIIAMMNHNANKDLDRIKYAKLLNSTYKNSIVDVKSSGYGKLSVIVNSAREANIILSDKSLESMGLRASIPSYFVSCQGVIGDVPTEMSEKEIIDNLVILNNVHKIIGNLIQMLTNFISAISSGNSPKSEECHNLINSLSSSLSALSSNLLHP